MSTYFDLLDKETLARIAFNIKECDDYESFMGCEPPNRCLTCDDAARNGHLTCLKRLNESKQITKRTGANAALGGHLDCLQWIHNTGHTETKHLELKAGCKGGHINVLEYLFGDKGPSQFQMSRCIEVASKNGRIDVLLYLRDKSPDKFEACTVCNCYCRAAVRGGQYECLQWLVDNGFCLMHATDARRLFIYTNHGHGCEYWSGNQSSIGHELMDRGDLDCIRFVEERVTKYRFSEDDACTAVRYGRFDVLKYMYENECELTGRMSLYAATYGHLEILKWLHENGCPWSSGVTRAARNHNEIECLEYALNNGCLDWYR
jgi:hypothetical protein